MKKLLVIFMLSVLPFSFCRAELTLPKAMKKAPERKQEAEDPQKVLAEREKIKKEEANKALFEAVSKRHLKGIYNALLAGADINAYNSYGSTPLMEAIDTQSIGTVKYVIKCGADVNLLDTSADYPPIMLASKLGDIEIIDILLENGANIQASIKDGLQYSKGQIYLFKFDTDSLTAANDFQTIKHLFQKGYKPNGKSLSATLYESAKKDDLPAIKFLVNKGLNYKEFDMTPAYVFSVEEGFFDMVKYLRAKGAKLPNKADGVNTNNKDVYNYLKGIYPKLEYTPNTKAMKFTTINKNTR